MCRLLAMRDETPFAIGEALAPFATMARASKEYQGDGWGCAWRDHAGWTRYRSLTPVWDDDLSRFGEARVLVAHARSAFRNEGIEVENNMPFLEGESAFVFNGELSGVRIAEAGRIGAEKLFRFLLRMRAVAGEEALRRAVDVVVKRTRRIRAMNFVLAAGEAFHVSCLFDEDPSYFTLHALERGRRLAICSEPLVGAGAWTPLPSGTLRSFV